MNEWIQSLPLLKFDKLSCRSIYAYLCVALDHWCTTGSDLIGTQNIVTERERRRLWARGSKVALTVIDLHLGLSCMRAGPMSLCSPFLPLCFQECLAGGRDAINKCVINWEPNVILTLLPQAKPQQTWSVLDFLRTSRKAPVAEQVGLPQELVIPSGHCRRLHWGPFLWDPQPLVSHAFLLKVRSVQKGKLNLECYYQ